MSETTATPTETAPTIDSTFAEAYRLGVQTLYILDLPEEQSRLYKQAGRESDPEALAAHDGPVLYDGQIVRFATEGDSGLIGVYHGWAGKQGTLVPSDDVDAVALVEVEPDE